MSNAHLNPNDPVFPVCEQARDILMTYEQTPRSQHLPRGETPYYAASHIVKFLHECSQGKTVFLCKCARCRKHAGLLGGVDNRASRWDEGEFLGDLATTFALLIYLRCPGLISLFRRNGLSLNKNYLSAEQLRFLDKTDVLAPLQATNIRMEIVRTQYQFHVRKFAKRNEITIIDEKETLPIEEDQDATGKGDFGEVYPFNVPEEYVDGSLKYLKTSRFARKIFRQLSTESKPVKEFVLQQLKSNQFQHPHLMPALAAFEHGSDYFFILFELAESTLYKFLIGDGPSLSTRVLWEQVLGLASGLAYLHGISVEGDEQNSGRMIHRDLKPANVLIVRGVMKIADFGFASYKPWPTTTDSRYSDEFAYEGINTYSPPPSDEICEKYDVYSLGAIISEIISFDIGKASRVAQYRQKRLDDSAGELDNRSRRFYYYKSRDLKKAVIDEHSSLLKVVREESTKTHTGLHPWQEFFYEEALFKMIEKMLHASKANRPTATDVAGMLEEFSRRAELDITQNVGDRHEHHLVNDLVEHLITSPPGPAEPKNRFIANFAKGKKCCLWLYPNASNEKIKMLRFQYALVGGSPVSEREREIYVDRNQMNPYTGLKPLYLDASKGNAVDLINLDDPDENLVYTFCRLSDALRFQGIMTGERVYRDASLQLTEFSLRNYQKPSSSSSLIFRNKKSKGKNNFRGGKGQLQMWTRDKLNSPTGPDVKIVILTGDKLIIIKVTGQFVQNAKGLTKMEPPLPPTMARLAFAETVIIDMIDGIPISFDPQKYNSHEEVRLFFKDENDTKCFWRNLIEIQTEFFAEKPGRGAESPKSPIMARIERINSLPGGHRSTGPF